MSGVILRPGTQMSNDDDEYEEDFYLPPPPSRPMPPRIPNHHPKKRSQGDDDQEDPMETFEDDIQLHPSDASYDREDAEDVNKKGTENDEGEKDAGFLYFSLVVAGLGVLLPFNCFTIAADYYIQRFPDYNIVFNINMTYLACNFVGVLFGNLFVETISFSARTMAGFAVALTALLFVTIFDILLELFNEDRGYKLTLSAVAISALGTSGKFIL